MADNSAANAQTSRSPSDRERVRSRPGMYVGTTSPHGVFVLTCELLDNSIDQVIAGRASLLEVVLHSDGSVEVIDDGDGLDLASPETRAYFSELHDTATADGHSPHFHGGLRGVGVFPVNALSARFVCTSAFDGVAWRAEWENGASDFIGLSSAEPRRGTAVRFWPDSGIFESGPFEVGPLVERLNGYAALIPGLEVRLGDRIWLPRSPAQSLQRLLNGGEATSSVHYLEGAWSSGDDEVNVRCIFSQSRSETGSLTCYTNYRLVDARCALRDEIRGAFSAAFESADAPAGSQARLTYGDLDVVVSVLMPGARFSGPTKAAIDDPTVVAGVAKVLTERLPNSLRELHQR